MHFDKSDVNYQIRHRTIVGIGVFHRLILQHVPPMQEQDDIGGIPSLRTAWRVPHVRRSTLKAKTARPGCFL